MRTEFFGNDGINMDYPLLGITEIDEQHRQLIVSLEQLRYWQQKGHGYSAALNALQELAQYVVGLKYEVQHMLGGNVLRWEQTTST